MKTLALLHSTVRIEEKRRRSTAGMRNVEVRLIDIRKEIFNPKTYIANFDIVLQGSVSIVKGTYGTLEFPGLHPV